MKLNILCELIWDLMCISTKQMLMPCFSSNQCKELVSLLTYEEAVREVYLYKHYSYRLQTLFSSVPVTVFLNHIVVIVVLGLSRCMCPSDSFSTILFIQTTVL